MPARTASVTLSTISCRTMCAWLAPSADRIAISRSRPALRASESPAMFAIAMSSTNETAAGQHPQRQSRRRSGDIQGQRHDADAALAGCRRLFVQPPRDRVHLRLSLLERDVRPQPRDDEPGAGAARTSKCFPIRKQRVRLPHFGIVELELGREDANDARRKPVDHERGTDGIARPAETGLPEVVTDERQSLPLVGFLL